jgi:type IV secretion system protein VirD4
MRFKIVMVSIILVFGTIAGVYLTSVLHFLLSNINTVPTYVPFWMGVDSILHYGIHAKMFLLFEVLILVLAALYFIQSGKHYESDVRVITPKIKIPVAAGQGQCGTADFLPKSEYDKVFGCTYSGQDVMDNGGIVVHMERGKLEDKIYYINNDSHTLISGKSGSGKTRRFIIQSILNSAKAGNSVVASDPKGELFAYLQPELKAMGIDVKALDFKNPELSHCINLMQTIIDAWNDGDRGKTERYAWDLTNTLVGDAAANSEKLWHNGEMSIIAASIICVVVENAHNPALQNLTNVYHFINEMCKPIGGKLPLVKFIESCSPDHPARPLLGISEVAPQRTRGSFYTSALATLNLFTTQDVYAITHKSDFALDDVGKKQQAIFIILPDEKSTYYPIASLFVSQQYIKLIELADSIGGQLKVKVDYYFDEWGNFTYIPDWISKLTAARSRGIRFNLCVQDFTQIKEKYNDNIANIVKSNCNWIYLSANDTATLKEVSERLGKYTTTSYSLGTSQTRHQNASSSENISLIGRELLMPDEVGKIESPYAIVIFEGEPAVTYLPDLSMWHYNKILGLGSEKHNQRIWMERKEARPVRNDVNAEIRLWFNLWRYWQDETKKEVAAASARQAAGNSMKNKFLQEESYD